MSDDTIDAIIDGLLVLFARLGYSVRMSQFCEVEITDTVHNQGSCLVVVHPNHQLVVRGVPGAMRQQTGMPAAMLGRPELADPESFEEVEQLVTKYLPME